MLTGGLRSLRHFFWACWFSFSKRVSVFALINLLYFGSVLVSALLTQSRFPPYGKPIEVPEVLSVEWGGLPVLFLNIFLLSFFVSAFLLLTVTGMVFFLFPMGVLVWRAWFWGGLLSQLPTSSFLAVLPTLILEGEGYVLASVVGMVLGLSWLKPSVVFGSERFSRVEAFKEALKEAARLYVAVALILLAAALVEAVTITLLT